MRDSGLGPLTLDIEECPRGRDLDLAYLEIEEP